MVIWRADTRPRGFASMAIASDVMLGRNVTIPQPDLVNLYGCTIGDDTRNGPIVEIQRDAAVGRRCKISSHTFICAGVTIEDAVFIGHGVMFTNDLFPAAIGESGELKTDDDWTCVPTRVCSGAAIGSNATIIAGVTIGAHALVGAGAVVTQDVPPGVTVAGVPARVIARKETP